MKREDEDRDEDEDEEEEGDGCYKASLPHFNQSKLTALVCGCGNHFLLDLGLGGGSFAISGFNIEDTNKMLDFKTVTRVSKIVNILEICIFQKRR